MPDLHCSVSNCAYNSDCLCSCGSIHVNGNDACTCGETCCSTYADACNCGCQNSAADPETTVGCSVTNCRFNENSACQAKHISIEGHGRSADGTCCSSFESR